MKQSVGFERILKVGFDSPFVDVFVEEKNEFFNENLKGIMELRTNPEFQKIGKVEKFSDEMIWCLKIGFGRKYKQGFLSCSLLFLVIKEILLHLSLQFPDQRVDVALLSKILRGSNLRKYVSNGNNGNVIIDALVSENSSEEKEKINYFMKILSSYYIQDGKNTDVSVLKLSDQGIKYLEDIDTPKEIIEGFKEITIEDTSTSTFTLAIAIIVAIHTIEDLFLCFDIVTNELGIYEKFRLPIVGNRFCLICNLTTIIKESIGEERVKELRKQTKGKLIAKDKNELYKIASMTKEITNKLIHIAPDNFDIRIEGTFSNMEKVDGLRETFPSDRINRRFIKGSPRYGEFDLRYNLKKYSEKSKL